MAALTFRQLAYHTLCVVGLYLTRDEQSYEVRDLHLAGGDERQLQICAGLDNQYWSLVMELDDVWPHIVDAARNPGCYS